MDKNNTELNTEINNTTSSRKISQLGNLKATLNKYKKAVSDIRKERIEDVEIMKWKPPFQEIEFVPYEDVLELSKNGKALKLSSDHMFGNIHINPSKLLQMRLEAYDNNGKKVISWR